MIAILLIRPWLPRAKVQVVAEDGSIIAERVFWTVRGARTWVTELTYSEASLA